MDEEQKTPSPAIIIRERIKRANLSEKQSPQAQQVPSRDDNLAVDRSRALPESEQFLGEFPRRKASAIIRGLENLSGIDRKRYFSLIDLIRWRDRGEQNAGLSLREINRLFDPYLGSLILPKGINLKGSPLSGFFTDHRIFRDGEVVELRGDNYVVALNTHKKADKKLEIIESDLLDGLAMISQIKREEISTPQDYLLYLGILDYLKMHSITLFNSLTYGERVGKFPQPDTEEERKYIEYREKASKLARVCTRMFYQTLFGVEYDGDFDIDQEYLKQLVSYINDQMILDAATQSLGKLSYARIRYPEINHPLVIALGAQEVVRLHPGADTIVGIPTGGTEVAIVTQIIYELLNKKNTGVVFLPISLHSEIHTQPSQENLSMSFQRISGGIIQDKNVILVDDNSSSGKTLLLAKNVLMANGVRSVVVHLAEFDGRKLIEPASETDNKNYFNPQASPTTMGIHRFGIKNPHQHAYKEIVRSKLGKTI